MRTSTLALKCPVESINRQEEKSPHTLQDRCLIVSPLVPLLHCAGRLGLNLVLVRLVQLCGGPQLRFLFFPWVLCEVQDSFECLVCGSPATTQAARDALQRARAQLERSALVDSLALPQLSQHPLALCGNCVQAQPVCHGPALEQDVVVYALPVKELPLRNAHNVMSLQLVQCPEHAELIGMRVSHWLEELHALVQEALSSLGAAQRAELVSPSQESKRLPRGCIRVVGQRPAACCRVEDLQKHCAVRWCHRAPGLHVRSVRAAAQVFQIVVLKYAP